MPTGRAFGAQAVVDNVIYTIGGRDASSYGRTVEAYDPSTDTWMSKTSLPRSDGRYDLCAVAIQGKVYTVGGLNKWGTAATTTVDRHDPSTLTILGPWHEDVATYPKAVYGTACVQCQGYGYFFGGSALLGSIYNDTHKFDPASGAFFPRRPMPTARLDAFGALIGTKVYVIGGTAGLSALTIQKNEVYDTVNDTWSVAADIPSTATRGLAGVEVY